MDRDEPAFERALGELRLDDARSIAAAWDDAARSEALERVRAAEVRARADADKLAARIQELARSDHYAALLDLADDPQTNRLLGYTSREIRRGAMLHLDGAHRRRDRARQSARRQLESARRALDEFDAAEARKALDRIDDRWMSVDERNEFEEISVRAAKAQQEADELAAVTAEVLAEHRPPRAAARRGCLPAAVWLLTLAAAGRIALG